VLEEIAWAEKYGRPIVPLLYRKANFPNDLKHLERYQFEDFTKGGYSENFADLVVAVFNLGVDFVKAVEVGEEEREARRRQKLGDPVPIPWRQVFGKIPQWGLAWGIGWVFFWAVFLIFNAVFFQEQINVNTGAPLAGFIAGFLGGVLAGGITMFTLRHHSTNITWKHMAPTIRSMGLWGPMVAILTGGLVASLAQKSQPDIDCAGLNFGECFGLIFASALGYGVAVVFAIVFYSLLAFTLYAAVQGWRTVQKIRRLEPGIKGRHTFWIVIGWAVSAFVSAVGSIALIDVLFGL
jgi:hypothetical protein